MDSSHSELIAKSFALSVGDLLWGTVDADIDDDDNDGDSS